ncbi:hypothetical protein AOXY_G29580 [Acipenser oxyrinchus oxyrinchus]|uniref:Uncharacterized protein n=1 Tax=Acipenser oxyrinchus oxyrinchus TaxID=40147 RepID=A0AAD8FU24_ACIOX|nr:hypothetical protein AOXY_G29580 [Acipenser oxyrinchus oxyrinchus]
MRNQLRLIKLGNKNATRGNVRGWLVRVENRAASGCECLKKKYFPGNETKPAGVRDKAEQADVPRVRQQRAHVDPERTREN